MSPKVSFGRRVTPPTAPAVAPPPIVIGDPGFSPEAEAFRAELAAEKGDSSDFAAWRRSQRGRQLFAWAMTFAFLCPGALCYVFNAPALVSIGLELAGVLLNMGLRRQRRRRLTQIANWQG